MNPLRTNCAASAGAVVVVGATSFVAQHLNMYYCYSRSSSSSSRQKMKPRIAKFFLLLSKCGVSFARARDAQDDRLRPMTVNYCL